MTWRALQTRYAMFLERLETRRLISTLLAVSVLGSVPLLSLWQVAQSTGNEVRAIKNVAFLAPSPVTALLTVEQFSVGEGACAPGPKLIGQALELNTLASWQQAAAVYRDAFLNRVQAFPYFSQA